MKEAKINNCDEFYTALEDLKTEVFDFGEKLSSLKPPLDRWGKIWESKKLLLKKRDLLQSKVHNILFNTSRTQFEHIDGLTIMVTFAKKIKIGDILIKVGDKVRMVKGKENYLLNNVNNLKRIPDSLEVVGFTSRGSRVVMMLDDGVVIDFGLALFADHRSVGKIFEIIK